jgi:CubicO group peptidase (beta-lactamase class C family)
MRAEGFADEGFGQLADVFVANFDSGAELGAALSVYVDGRHRVHLWGGTADRETAAPWTQDTAAVGFSVTKGLTAICAHLLVQRGALDLDAPVSSYWPGYAQGGKETTTVRQALAHRAGVHALSRDLSVEDLIAWDPVVAAIEEQIPWWPPGTAFSYHALTFGWLIGELVRRASGAADFAGFFRREVAAPLGAAAWIGLPQDRELSLALLEPPFPFAAAPPPPAPLPGSDADLLTRSITLGSALAGGLISPGRGGLNDRRLLSASIPAAGGVTTADAVAQIYAACVSPVRGLRLLDDTSAKAALTIESSGPAWRAATDAGQRFSAGFMVGGSPLRPMLGESSFGHDGAGGQLAFADVTNRVGFGYLNNRMGWGDDRANRLTTALAGCLNA